LGGIAGVDQRPRDLPQGRRLLLRLVAILLKIGGLRRLVVGFLIVALSVIFHLGQIQRNDLVLGQVVYIAGVTRELGIRAFEFLEFFRGVFFGFAVVIIFDGRTGGPYFRVVIENKFHVLIPNLSVNGGLAVNHVVGNRGRLGHRRLGGRLSA